MTGASAPVPTAGVAMTALGVALIRAREIARPDRLYADPLAEVFLSAARPGFDAGRWAGLERLAEQYFEGRTLAVEVVDEHVRESIAAGCRQVVLLGAGLDTRAFRLDLPPDIAFFEVDLPELFDFKEPVLGAHRAHPVCSRRIVAADLCGDWERVLLERGFRADVPTAWVDEGVLGYVPRAASYTVVETATRLSAPGSRFGIGRFQVDAAAPQYRALRELVLEVPEGRPVNGLGPDGESWFAAHGWRTTFRAWDELIAPYGRPSGLRGDPAVGHVVAVRE
ncbi:SAM-dependent methyltransferase [Nocardia flavorosea]|uniref:SAM-dependent methyltransferase n=1 Tax=Nocardia flavorosea TaxID=53429 RepID=UPI002454FB0D|nr:SAM-dependent methyltransferase [Nocardia flavorosea]